MIENNPEQLPKTVLQTVYEWSTKKPMWLRDLLRKVIRKNNISNEEIIHIIALLKYDQSMKGDCPQSDPLKQTDIPSSSALEKNVTLNCIHSIESVNNLALNQELSFINNGITVVYGDNGSGKSGYARILKSACRARHREEVLPNIYSSNPDVIPKAKIAYSIDGSEATPVEWESSDDPHNNLLSVSVFDANCASVHIKKPNEVAYRPYGLDIPDRLVSTCKQIESTLKEELITVEKSENSLFQSLQWSQKTRAGTLMRSFTKDSSLENIETLSILSNEELHRLSQLEKTLSQDIKKAAKEEAIKSDRLELLRKHLETLHDYFSDIKLTTIKQMKQAAAEARRTADTIANKTFSPDLLPGTGNTIWKKLWDAAKIYSQSSSYPNKSYPYTDENSKCVLCQQPLSKEAMALFQNFNKLLTDNTERQAVIAEDEFQNSYSELFQHNCSLIHFKNTIHEINLMDIDLCKEIKRFFASIRLRRYTFKKTLAGHSRLSGFSNNPLDKLLILKDSSKKLATELYNVQDVEKLNSLKQECAELSDRKKLKDNMVIIKSEHLRLYEMHFLQKCISETNTTSITKLGNAIADKVITAKLRDHFLKEIRGIVGNNFRVEVKRAGGRYGAPRYKVCFVSLPAQDVASILSEGEQTCVAIAAFLAEISISNHKSALVFDDPISSLDHRWRNKVAKRLIEEAKSRQVIIFTHDLIFLNDIENYSQQFDVPFKSQHLSRYPNKVGVVNSNLPWDGMRINARIDALGKEARSLRSKRDNIDEESYKTEAKYFYSKLRASWERALEEVGLADTVMRHRDYIKSNNVIKLSVMDENDCKIWAQNFKICCDYTEAHDSSRGRNKALPEPDSLLKDLEALETWVKNLKFKHNEIQRNQC